MLSEIYLSTRPAKIAGTPYPSRRGLSNALQQVSAQNESVARLQPDDLMDDRFVRALDESGYIRALYGR